MNPLLEPVRQNCKKLYNMHHHVSVDEAMIKFGGQHASSVGAPNKPAKRGFKIFCICDAVTGYLCDFQVYHRKKKEIGLTQRVVEDLAASVYDRSHIIYVDKFYTSVDLALSLLSNTTYLCGSFQIGRKKWPNDLKPNKQLRKKDDPVRFP